MYFVQKIKELIKEETVIFVDMDGVIAEYAFKEELDFRHKRPLKSNIAVLKQIAKLPNVTLHILSICRKDTQIADKNYWLDKYASFFKERTIISKESNRHKASKELKLAYLQKFKQENPSIKLILIDDDNGVLKYIWENLEGIKLIQDSSLID